MSKYIFEFNISDDWIYDEISYQEDEGEYEPADYYEMHEAHEEVMHEMIKTIENKQDVINEKFQQIKILDIDSSWSGHISIELETFEDLSDDQIINLIHKYFDTKEYTPTYGEPGWELLLQLFGHGYDTHYTLASDENLKKIE